jgi:hypothetical protein
MKLDMSKGSASKTLIIMAFVVLVAIVVVYFGIKFAQKNQSVSPNPTSPLTTTSEPPKPEYDVKVGDIRFLLQSSVDFGTVLKGSSSFSTGNQPNLTTTERFIKVVIGAQNKGKTNFAASNWEVGNIIDSDGRIFNNINNKAYAWIPKPNTCGVLLKPEFAPISCVNIYEVSKISKGLRVQVRIKSPKIQQALIDLKL